MAIPRQFFGWAVAGVVPVWLLGFNGVTPANCQLILALVGITHSLVTLWTSGGARFSAPGIFCYGTAVFIYFPAIYLVFADPIRHRAIATLSALAISYFSQILMTHLMWEHRPSREVEKPSSLSHRVSNQVALGGIVLFCVGTLGHVFSFPYPVLSNGAAYTGIVLLAVSGLYRKGRVSAPLSTLLVGAVCLYGMFFFAGFGRLTFASLGIAICACAAVRWKVRIAKLVMILGTAPALLALARARVVFLTELYNRPISENGLESVISPFVRFSELLILDSSGQLTHTYGRSFWASVVFFIPRTIWPDKPVGFGAELVAIVSPQLVATGHSELATYLGEWLVSFGGMGIIAAIPVVGVAVRIIDRFLVRSQSSGPMNWIVTLQFVAAILLSSSLPDLVWGGTGTYITRVSSRLVFVGALTVAALLFVGHGSTGSRRAFDVDPGGSPRPALHLERGSRQQ